MRFRSPGKTARLRRSSGLFGRWPEVAEASSTALLTDRYELSMVQASLHSGAADRRVVFEVFARGLPAGRRYGVVAGIGRLLEALERFRFDEATVAFLARQGVVDEATVRWLSSYRFTGDIDGYPEGEIYVPGSPILVVEATFAEAVVLETLVLSALNHDCAIATAASRMTAAAEGRPCLEMGSRRTHEEAAVAAARAAYIAGFAATSNLEAGCRYQIPTAGTSAHAFTLVHDSERHAFQAQIEALGRGTTLLVDTYDVQEAVRTGVDVAGPDLGAIGIDSGDLPALARQVRGQLDELGAGKSRIVATGDLDEYAIARLSAAPVDAYGAGTAVVTASGAPTANLVYKLVARAESPSPRAPLVGIEKHSAGKATRGGRKYPRRRRHADGSAAAEIIGVHDPPQWHSTDRELHIPLVRSGQVLGGQDLATARARHHASRAELPPAAFRLSRGEPAIDTHYENGPT